MALDTSRRGFLGSTPRAERSLLKKQPNHKGAGFLKNLRNGDIVVAGKYVGAIRYLGPLYSGSRPPDQQTLFAGLELCEELGTMDGSLLVDLGKEMMRSMSGVGVSRKPILTKPGSEDTTDSPRDILLLKPKTGFMKSPSLDSFRSLPVPSDFGTKSTKKKIRYFRCEKQGNFGVMIPAASILKRIDAWTLVKKVNTLHKRNAELKQMCQSLEVQQHDTRVREQLYRELIAYTSVTSAVGSVRGPESVPRASFGPMTLPRESFQRSSTASGTGGALPMIHNLGSGGDHRLVTPHSVKGAAAAAARGGWMSDAVMVIETPKTTDATFKTPVALGSAAGGRSVDAAKEIEMKRLPEDSASPPLPLRKRTESSASKRKSGSSSVERLSGSGGAKILIDDVIEEEEKVSGAIALTPGTCSKLPGQPSMLAGVSTECRHSDSVVHDYIDTLSSIAVCDSIERTTKSPLMQLPGDDAESGGHLTDSDMPFDADWDADAARTHEQMIKQGDLVVRRRALQFDDLEDGPMRPEHYVTASMYTHGHGNEEFLPGLGLGMGMGLGGMGGGGITGMGASAKSLSAKSASITPSMDGTLEPVPGDSDLAVIDSDTSEPTPLHRSRSGHKVSMSMEARRGTLLDGSFASTGGLLPLPLPIGNNSSTSSSDTDADDVHTDAEADDENEEDEEEDFIKDDMTTPGVDIAEGDAVRALEAVIGIGNEVGDGNDTDILDSEESSPEPRGHEREDTVELKSADSDGGDGDEDEDKKSEEDGDDDLAEAVCDGSDESADKKAAVAMSEEREAVLDSIEKGTMEEAAIDSENDEGEEEEEEKAGNYPIDFDEDSPGYYRTRSSSHMSRSHFEEIVAKRQAKGRTRSGTSAPVSMATAPRKRVRHRKSLSVCLDSGKGEALKVVGGGDLTADNLKLYNERKSAQQILRMHQQKRSRTRGSLVDLEGIGALKEEIDAVAKMSGGGSVDGKSEEKKSELGSDDALHIGEGVVEIVDQKTGKVVAEVPAEDLDDGTGHQVEDDMRAEFDAAESPPPPLPIADDSSAQKATL